MSPSMVSWAEAAEMSDFTDQACHTSMEQMEQNFHCDFTYAHSNCSQKNTEKSFSFVW